MANNFINIFVILSVWFLLVDTSNIFAASARKLVNEGNKLVASQNTEKMSEALEKYLEAREKRKNRFEIPFNIGTTYGELNRIEEASSWLLEASKSKDYRIKSDAFYQLGNLYFKQQQYDKAIQSYMQALKYSPGDSAARKNLELAYWLSKVPPPDSTQQNQNENKNESKEKSQNSESEQPNQNDQMLQRSQMREAETQKKLLKKRNEGNPAYPASGKDW